VSVLPDARPADAAPFVPIMYVQAAANKPTGTSASLPLLGATHAQDAIVVCLNYPVGAGANLTAVTDEVGDTFAIVLGPLDSASDRHYVAVALDTAGGASDITITTDVALANGADLLAAEYSGIARSGAVDAIAHENGTGTAMTSGQATTKVTNELIVGCAEASNAMPGPGFAQRTAQSGNILEDRIGDAAGSYEATATDANNEWTMIMVTLEGESR
jgi:hypothetical protein